MLAESIALAAAPAAAMPAVQLSYEAGIVSDYRFRGLSLSDEKPAIQAGATISFAGGAYLGIWGSTIDEYAEDGDDSGSTAEVDISAGWAFAAAGLDVDVSVWRYSYPGAEGLGFFEVPVSASRRLGPATLALGAAYAPAQSALADRDNRYAWASVGWTAGPLALTLQSGHEDGAFAPDGKWDWSLTAGRAFGPFLAALSYVDTDAPGAGEAVVASLKAAF